MLGKVIRSLEWFIEPISRWLNYISVVFLLLMVLFITTDVFLRYALNRPIEGSYEVIELMMIFAVAFGAAYTQRRKGHVTVDMLVSRFKEKSQAVNDTIIYFICLIFLVVLTWMAATRARAVWIAGDITIGKLAGVISLPVGPFNYLVALALAVLSVAILLDFLVSLGKAVKKWIQPP